MRRRVTVKDVALRAGVTQPAVSVVLNGARSNTLVSDLKRQKILQAAKELGYRPNLSAQTMRSGKSRMVGVLLRNNSRAVYDEKWPILLPTRWYWALMKVWSKLAT
jgi:DNA-binding LacI/PurR family transcriptional regulator